MKCTAECGAASVGLPSGPDSSAIAAGATIINDVWGFKRDPAIAQVVAESGVVVVLMHNRSQSQNAVHVAGIGGRYVDVQYENLMQDVTRELMDSITLALAAGVAPTRIIIDPGLGFGKTMEQNLELIDRLGELRRLGEEQASDEEQEHQKLTRTAAPGDSRKTGTTMSTPPPAKATHPAVFPA